MHYRRVVVLARNKQMVMPFHVNTVDKFCHVDLPQLVDPMGVLPKCATEVCGR